MKKILLLIILLWCSLLIFADNTINISQKWEEMLKKSNSYQEYKVVKTSELNNMWKLIQDHIKSQESGMANEQNLVSQQKSKIDVLEKQMEIINKNVVQINNEKESIQFFSSTFNKYTYTNFLWILVGLTLLASVILFMLYHRSNQITIQKSNDFNDLTRSFEEYKLAKIDSERKLKRELQTLINKSEESKKDNAGFGRGN